MAQSPQYDKVKASNLQHASFGVFLGIFLMTSIWHASQGEEAKTWLSIIIILLGGLSFVWQKKVMEHKHAKLAKKTTKSAKKKSKKK